MKIVTWNVNGIRACEKQGLADWHRGFAPDLLCFQEVRAEEHQLSVAMREPEGCAVDYHPAEKKGYSGTGVWMKRPAQALVRGVGIAEYDAEGRVQELKYPGFTLFNVYFPNGSRDHSRVPFKLSFYEALLARIQALHAQGERVIVTGDFNTAHQAIDLANPKANVNTTGFLVPEREMVDRYLSEGLKDVFRDRHPGENGHYTWWSNRPGVRERNIGWRIDYFLVSEALVPFVKDVYILPEVKGSDHCPVVLELDDALLS
ncbi:exodeoxyribonuclease III [bacterium]|nr:exodeoxyribonuclease III [bacterium]